jgi:putative ABC transport system permease protein
VLAFALLISALTGLVFGLAPALHSAKVALSSAIREGARGSGYSAKTGRLRDVLIVSELAFAVMLMVGAGLLLRTLRDLLRENPGFNSKHVVTANGWLPVPNNPKVDPYLSIGARTVFNRETLRRMREIPGVDLAAIVSNLPTTPQTNVANFERADHRRPAGRIVTRFARRKNSDQPGLFQSDAGAAGARAAVQRRR